MAGHPHEPRRRRREVSAQDGPAPQLVSGGPEVGVDPGQRAKRSRARGERRAACGHDRHLADLEPHRRREGLGPRAALDGCDQRVAHPAHGSGDAAVGHAALRRAPHPATNPPRDPPVGGQLRQDPPPRSVGGRADHRRARRPAGRPVRPGRHPRKTTRR